MRWLRAVVLSGLWPSARAAEVAAGRDGPAPAHPGRDGPSPAHRAGRDGLSPAPRAPPADCAVNISARVDCGFLNISKSLCEARGCCFVANASQTPFGPPSCFFEEPGVPIKKAHLVLSNHFDAGYTDLAADELADANSPGPGVINLYFQQFFPLAAKTGAALRAARGTPLRWMTQQWLVSLFLDCPAENDLGIVCPSEANVTEFRAAVAAGDVTWHAFPHNAQLSLGSASLIKDLVAQVHATDDSLNVSRKRVLSQRDVVGLPRSIVSLLNASGVAAISVGSNGRCLPPNVPNAFRWRDRDVAETLVLWHAYFRRADIPLADRDAAAATWTFHGSKPRRRRGRDVDIPW